MSTTANEQATVRVQRAIEVHAEICAFLTEFEELIVSLSEPVMSKLFEGDEEVPYVGFWTSAGSVTFTVYGPDQRAMMRTLRKGIGGEWRKGGYGDTFQLSRRWNEILYLTITGERKQVCQAVKVGVEEVHHAAVEAQPARTEFVDKVEWHCGNLLND